MGAGWRRSKPRGQCCELQKPGPQQEQSRMLRDPCLASKATACPGCRGLQGSAAQSDTPKQPFSSSSASPPSPAPRVQEINIWAGQAPPQHLLPCKCQPQTAAFRLTSSLPALATCPEQPGMNGMAQGDEWLQPEQLPAPTKHLVACARTLRRHLAHMGLTHRC